MRLKALVIAASLMAYAAPAMAQGVEVHDHGKKDKDHIEVRGHAPEAKVSGFTPASGPVGTVVTINGTGFLPKTKVRIGGRPVRELSITPTAITFAVPGRYFDGVITLKHPGQGNEIMVGTFAVHVDPRIASFQPQSGPVGTRVELAGEGFLNGDQVLFNGRPLPLAEFGASRIVVIIPQGATTDEFTISRPSTNYRWSSKQKFQVALPAPTVSGISPTQGPPGTQVRISGPYFNNDDRVYYGGQQPVNVVARAEGWIDVQVPANARQSNPFTIKGPRGTVQTPVFVLAVNPTISRFRPDVGPPGTQVDVFGTNFQPGDQIYMNGRPLKRIAYLEDKLTVEIPQGASTDRLALWRNGQAIATSDKRFYVFVAPTVASFTPAQGPGGTKVQISGANFGNDTRVSYGAQPLNIVARRGETGIDVIVPKGAGNHPFTLTSRGGSVSTATAFQVVEPSAILAITPGYGPVGTRVTISMSGYTGNDRFWLSNVLLPIVEKNAGGYVVQIPPGTSTARIEWESPGSPRQLSTFRFTVQKPPTYVSMDPLSGAPGSKVTINGADFSKNTQVRSSVAGWPVIRRSGTQLTVLVPQEAKPGKDFLFIEDDGVSLKTTQQFEVLGRATGTGYSPAGGPPGTKVTVTGNYFDADTNIYLGNRLLPANTRSATAIEVTIPEGARKDWIWVADGPRKVKLTPMFEVTAVPAPPPPPPPAPQPAVCSFIAAPANPPAGSNVTIDVANCNLKNVKRAWFKGQVATIVSAGPTAIVVQLPAGASGTDNIALESDDGRGVAQRVRTNNKITVKAGY